MYQMCDVWRLLEIFNSFTYDMKQVRRYVSLFLIAIVGLSTTGLVINSHYCKDELKSSALFLKARPCHSIKAKAVCPMHSATGLSQNEDNDCCDDKSKLLKSDTELNHVPTCTDLDQSQEWNPVVFQSPSNHDPTIFQSHLRYLNYKPPLIVCDIPLRLQTFLC